MIREVPTIDEIAAYIRTQPTKTFTKDCILTYQGEMPRSLYAIRSGYVKIYDLSSDGNEQFLGIAGKYDFLPSETLFSDMQVAQFFYSAFTPVEVYAINRQEFVTMVRSNNAALFQIAKVVTAKYHDQMRHLAAVQKSKAREKIIYVLHYLSTMVMSDDQAFIAGRPVPLPLTQQDIANMVGVTRETAAHELKILKVEGYISYSKSAFYINTTLAGLVS